MSRELELIRAFGDDLTKRQVEVLAKIRDEGEAYFDGEGYGYVGVERFSGGTFNALLRACAVSADSGASCYYHVSETGLAILERRP